MANHHVELFERCEHNPILTAANWPYPVNSVFNPGATLLPDGTTLLLCRVEDRRGLSHLCVARSANGVDRWEIDSRPTMPPDPERFPEELWGIEDPRISSTRHSRAMARACRSRSRRISATSSGTASSCRPKTRTPRCCPIASTVSGL